MTAARELDRIVDRVKKLLALTSSQNPHEAALAAAKAQELLFRHNLSLATVEAATEGGGNAAYVSDRFDSGGWMHWRRRLLAAVARNNFCRGVSYQGTRDVGIVGEPHNVTVVRHLYAFLVREVMRLAELGAKTERGLDEEEARAWKRSFYLGAVRTVAQRLATQRQRDVASDSQAAALVVRKDEELDKAYKDHFPGTGGDDQEADVPPLPPRRDTGPSRPRRADGYRAGVLAGRTIPLNLPIEAPRRAPGRRRQDDQPA